MLNNVPQILKICSDLESDVARIYRSFAEMFPEAMAFWSKLATDEEGHAAVLLIACKYAEMGKLPDIVEPELLTHLQSTLEMVATINGEIKDGKISLREALGMALNLEETVHENYIHDLLALDTESDVVGRLQKIAAETDSHAARVKDYIDNLG